MLIPTLRSLAKSCIVLAWGRETRPRRVVRGLASGYWICVSPVDHLGYLLGTSEPHLQRIIREYVAEGDTVYDIGANIGYVPILRERGVMRDLLIEAWKRIFDAAVRLVVPFVVRSKVGERLWAQISSAVGDVLCDNERRFLGCEHQAVWRRLGRAAVQIAIAREGQLSERLHNRKALVVRDRITGNVTFSAGNSTLGTVALSGGKAAITTSTLPAGNNTITAAYAGTANIVGSVASLIQVVN